MLDAISSERCTLLINLYAKVHNFMLCCLGETPLLALDMSHRTRGYCTSGEERLALPPHIRTTPVIFNEFSFASEIAMCNKVVVEGRSGVWFAHASGQRTARRATRSGACDILY